MKINEIASYIWKDRKRRNVSIMSIVIVVLLVLLILNLSNTYQPPLPGAKRVLICKKCRALDIRRVVDMKKERFTCDKCGGDMAIAWKCGVCKYEYYIIPLKPNSELKTTMQIFMHIKESHRCPNCKEMRNVHRMTVNEYEAEYGNKK